MTLLKGVIPSCSDVRINQRKGLKAEMAEIQIEPASLSLADIDRSARCIRSRAGVDVRNGSEGTSASEFLAALTLTRHPFADEMHFLPVTNFREVVAHNLRTTVKAMEMLSHSNWGPEEVLYVGSRVVELGGHELEDPGGRERPRVHLASAKSKGYFFTPPRVARLMTKGLLNHRSPIDFVVDPACGSGALLGAVMIDAHRQGIRVKRVLGIERDEFTAELARQLLTLVADRLDLSIDIEVRPGDGLNFLATVTGADSPDAIILNPPYGRVKFLKDRFTNYETKARGSDEALSNEAGRRREQALLLSADLRVLAREHGLDLGAQDFYRLFLGLAFDALAPEGRMAAITPSGWLGDLHARKLRSKLVESGLIRQIEVLPENLRLFHTVNQETAITIVGPAVSSDKAADVVFTTHDKDGTVSSGTINLDLVAQADTELRRIPRLKHSGFWILERLMAGRTIASSPELRNLRGELDLTQDRNLLMTVESRESETLRTDVPVVRGNEIERYRYSPSPETTVYMTVEDYYRTYAARPKGMHTKMPRLACRQVSYLKKPRRLSWALVPPGHVIANSCNYLVVEGVEEADESLLMGLLTVLNSTVVEWVFRAFNSNNHVSNYEIDALPLPSTSDLTGALAILGRHLNTYYTSTTSCDSAKPGALEDVADAVVAMTLGLDQRELFEVMCDIEPDRATRVASIRSAIENENIAQILSGTGWFQHLPPRLSDLDRLMISHVPQGGNWQSIPETVPSKRLEQIREMTKNRGVVRTTYYGRLRPDQPAYTISTYFNRPGNGTNIHPWEDRTISAREAARLQSFPDWYIFAGTEGSIRNQIGNAVPPRLAHSIGRHLLSQVEGNTGVDLFAGAGGLSCGLELSGWNIVAAVDNDASAARTYRLNQPMPGTNSIRRAASMIEADLLNSTERAKALEEIRDRLEGRKPDAVFGGPPCQGFSTAGWRQDNDERNELASIFLEFVDKLDPDLVVLENVEGLLNYRKGKVLQELLAVLAELGYQTSAKPWVLAAEMYGVPQMRRRVFLVGHKARVIDEPEPEYARCLGRRENPDQLDLTQVLPYPITVAEALRGLARLSQATHQSMGRRPIRSIFEPWINGSPHKGENTLQR